MRSGSSVRTKVLVYTSCIVGAALLFIFLQNINHSHKELSNELDKRLNVHLKSVVPNLSERLWVVDTRGVQRLIDGLSEDPDFAYAKVEDTEGNLIVEATGVLSRESVTAERLPLVFAPRNISLGYVTLELSHERLDQVKQTLILENALMFVVTLLLVFIGILICFRQLNKPLDELTEVMKYLASDNLSIPVPYLNRNDEIGQISKAVEVFKNYAMHRKELMIKQAENEKMLTYQAHYDGLTNLPNRFLSLDRLMHAVREAERSQRKVALLYVDLDDFKKINDTLGHDTGDRLLVDVAARLRELVRTADTLGRLGGDEFVAVLGDLRDPADAQLVAEQLISSLRKPFAIDGRELMVTTSIGISVYPDDGEQASELLRKADSAMYHAKSQGRNTYAFFTEEMNHRVSHRLAIEQAMHGALQRGEFSVYYQPLIDVASGETIGSEALLRWDSPHLGRVPPDDFIPVAEQNSMILDLGEYVLKDAVMHTMRWSQMAGRQLKASVNISPRQFRDPDILKTIKQTLSNANMPTESLSLELTEGVVLSSDKHSLAMMQGLSDAGISIAMDDFGTGYSSLSYVRSFPFDVIKIDRSFVNDITEDPADLELVQAAIAMSHGLNLTAIAEGVETEQQLQLLREMGCDQLQGYLFGAPMPAPQFDEYLRSRERA